MAGSPPAPRPSLQLLAPLVAEGIRLPMVEARISAGFPSPAGDHLEDTLDLNRLLIRNPSATFFARVQGTSMEDAGIHPGDILVIDKSLEPTHRSVLVCFIDGDFTVKRVERIGGDLYLMPQSKDFKPIRVEPGADFRLWGVVTHCIHSLR